MIFATRFARMMALALTAALGACVHTPPVPDMGAAVRTSAPQSVTVPFVLDNNCMFVEVVFTKPDGSPRKALALVNMGSGAFVLSNALYRELEPGKNGTLRLSLGGMAMTLDWAAVQPEAMANTISVTIPVNPFAKSPTPENSARGPGGQLADLFSPLPVEAIIPPGVLAHFTVVMDYGAKTLTLAAPGSVRPEGVGVPMRVNPVSGFVVVDLAAKGGVHEVVIDNGGSYSGFRDAAWIGTAGLRSIGGIGAANYVMTARVDGAAPVVKLANVRLGSLMLKELGLVETSAQGWLAKFGQSVFWDWYSQKAGARVEGWIGGNVLKSFRLTLDYRAGMSWWQQEAPLDTEDLDQVGIVLARAKGTYVVSAIARKEGRPAVTGIDAGDVLVSVDGHKAEGATRGEILAALHGKPGERRHLVLERAGKRVEVDATVTGF